MIGKRRKFLTFLLGLFLVATFLGWRFYSNWEAKGPVQLALLRNRDMINIFRDYTGEYPVMKGVDSDFWVLEKNPCFKLTPTMKNGKVAPEFLLNPVTGKYDWLVEDASGTLYSPDMPNSVLIASPPIRVVNIRCPLTASDPPFFEDFTKW